MPKELTDKDIERIIRSVKRTIGNSDRMAVNDALFKVVLFQITHPGKGQDKWDGVRWLLSEMAQFALRDYQY